MTYFHIAVVFAISMVKTPLSRETKYCRLGRDCDKINWFALNLCKGIVSHQEILRRPPVWPLILSDAHKYLSNYAYVRLKPIVACYYAVHVSTDLSTKSICGKYVVLRTIYFTPVDAKSDVWRMLESYWVLRSIAGQTFTLYVNWWTNTDVPFYVTLPPMKIAREPKPVNGQPDDGPDATWTKTQANVD